MCRPRLGEFPCAPARRFRLSLGNSTSLISGTCRRVSVCGSADMPLREQLLTLDEIPDWLCRRRGAAQLPASGLDDGAGVPLHDGVIAHAATARGRNTPVPEEVPAGVEARSAATAAGAAGPASKCRGCGYPERVSPPPDVHTLLPAVALGLGGGDEASTRRASHRGSGAGAGALFGGVRRAAVRPGWTRAPR